MVKVKSYVARSLSVENLLPQNVEWIINYTCSNVTEIAQWGAPSCSRPQPANKNVVRDGRSNWLVFTPHPTQDSTPELQVLHGANAAANHYTYFSHWDENARPSECQANALSVLPRRVFSSVGEYLQRLLWSYILLCGVPGHWRLHHNFAPFTVKHYYKFIWYNFQIKKN